MNENLEVETVTAALTSLSSDTDPVEQEVLETARWLALSRFEEITRLFSARQRVRVSKSECCQHRL
jgi:hypothetical protein